MCDAPRDLRIVSAGPGDVPLIVDFIRKLAEYEKLSHEVVADESLIRQALFGARPAAEVVFAFLDGEPVGFALFFMKNTTNKKQHNKKHKKQKKKPKTHKRGVGKALLKHLASLAV